MRDLLFDELYLYIYLNLLTCVTRTWPLCGL